MLEMMRSLEPRFEDKRKIIVNELDEQNEVIFFDNGTYEIGFELNGNIFYKIQYKNSNPIGAFGVTFNKRSQFIYRTCGVCRGFFIRKTNWMKIMQSHEQVTDEFKGQIVKEFELKVKRKLNVAKRIEIKKMRLRNDVD